MRNYTVTCVDPLINPFSFSTNIRAYVLFLSRSSLPFIRLSSFFSSPCFLFLFPFLVMSRDANDAGGNPEVLFLGVGESSHAANANDTSDIWATDIEIDRGCYEFYGC